MSLSVICAGLGRTGTLSLKIALEKLGVGKCYHMIEARKNPDHSMLWKDVAEGKRVDWDRLFKGFSAVADWPACIFWRQLYEKYPGARVILNTRDSNSWYQSLYDTVYQVLQKPVPPENTELRNHRAMTRKIILECTFDNRFQDRTYAINVYERHNEAILHAIPRGRLLSYRIEQGWGPLCSFLERPIIPSEPFPHANAKEEFRANFLVKDRKNGGNKEYPQIIVKA